MPVKVRGPIANVVNRFRNTAKKIRDRFAGRRANTGNAASGSGKGKS